jgi:two-component system sensor histidine kinase KdpD
VCVVPLTAEDECIGVLTVDLGEARRTWQLGDVQHLQALARLAATALQRARLSEAARRAAAAVELESTRSALLASISHDLRTPLAVIAGSASALREQGERLGRERQAELLRTIESEANHMATVADNALQLARLSAGPLALRRDWESLEEIVGSVVARARRREPSPAITVRVAAGLPLVRVDAVLLAQLLANLIENACVHAADGGPIEVEVRPLADVIEVSVADRGPGFGRVDPCRVFERGGAGAAPSDRRRGGAGLGLPICKAIVEAHGGSITAAARVGGGAVIRFRLPLGEAPPGPAAS